GIEALIAGSSDDVRPPARDATSDAAEPDGAARTNAAAIVDEEQQGQPHRPQEAQQEVSMDDDQNLGDDMVKLVEYDIISVKRDHERKVHSGKTVVTKPMTPESFAIMVTTEYTSSDEYARDVELNRLHRITSEDKKFLRVPYRVVSRWPREEEEYDKEQA